MIFETVMALTSVANLVYYINQRSKKNQKPVIKQELDPCVQELIKSIESDDGWFFTPFNKETNTCSHYKNSKSKIRFTMDKGVTGFGDYGGIIEPIRQNFLSNDKEELNKALSIMAHRTLIGARLKAYDEEIEMLESNELKPTKMIEPTKKETAFEAIAVNKTGCETKTTRTYKKKASSR